MSDVKIKRLLAAGLCAGCLLTAAPVLAAETEEAEAPGMTREAAIARLVRAAGLPDGAAESLGAFTDGSAVSPEIAGAVAAAVECGAVLGDGNAALRPADPITRLEALLVMGRLAGAQYASMDPADYNDVPAWAWEEIEPLSASGLIAEYHDPALGASLPVTEAETEALADVLAGRVLMDRLMAANRMENIFRNHQSIEITWHVYSGPSEGDGSTYNSAGLGALRDKYREVLLMDGLMLGYSASKPDDITVVLGVPEEFYQEQFDALDDMSEMRFLGGERITRNEIEDGLLRLDTEIAEPAASAHENENFEIFPYEGDRYVFSYRFEPETLEILAITATLRRDDGYEKRLAYDTINYDTAYDPAGSRFEPYFAANALRNVTVVYAPGTEQERTVTARLPKTIGLTFFYNEDFVATEFYTDPECTLRYEGSDPEDFSDLTLYLSPESIQAEIDAYLEELAEFEE